MIDGAPEIVHLAIDLHKHLVQVPAPLPAGASAVDASSLHLGSEYRAEPVPQEAHGLVPDLDAAPVEEVLDVAKRQREPHVENYRQADDLGAGLEVEERRADGHPRRPRRPPALLTPIALPVPPGEVATWSTRRDRRRMHSGLVLTVEPFLSTGGHWTTKGNDEWILYRELPASLVQYEHTVVATDRGAIIVTLPG